MPYDATYYISATIPNGGTGNDTTGLGTQLLPWATPQKAITVANGLSQTCLIIADATTIDCGVNPVMLPVNSELDGQGSALTKFLTQSVLSTNGVAFYGGTNAKFKGFTVQGNAASGISQGLIGLGSVANVDQVASDGVTYEDVVCIGDSDGVYAADVADGEGDPPPVTVRKFTNCPITTKFDAITNFSGVPDNNTTLEFHNCSASVYGPSTINQSQAFNRLGRAVHVTGGLTRLFNTPLHCEGQIDKNWGIRAHNIGIVQMFGASITTIGGGLATTPLDVVTEDSGQVYLVNVTYDPSKVSGTAPFVATVGNGLNKTVTPGRAYTITFTASSFFSPDQFYVNDVLVSATFGSGTMSYTIPSNTLDGTLLTMSLRDSSSGNVMNSFDTVRVGESVAQRSDVSRIGVRMGLGI